jgi:glutaredoxin
MNNKFKLELFYFPGCPFCDLVTGVIDKLQFTSIKMCNIKQNSDFQTKLLKDTGRKTVPCLYINDQPMHESKDIIQWLEKNKTSID